MATSAVPGTIFIWPHGVLAHIYSRYLSSRLVLAHLPASKSEIQNLTNNIGRLKIKDTSRIFRRERLANFLHIPFRRMMILLKRNRDVRIHRRSIIVEDKGEIIGNRNSDIHIDRRKLIGRNLPAEGLLDFLDICSVTSNRVRWRRMCSFIRPASEVG